MAELSAYNPPEFWSFKPFFTLQPVTATREKQLKLWRELILEYCVHKNLHRLIPSDFPFFRNAAIDRVLSAESINVVVNFVIKSGEFVLDSFSFILMKYLATKNL